MGARTVFLFAAISAAAFAQTGPTLSGAGYVNPVPVRVAPGQIVTFFVSGLTTVLAAPVKAGQIPLPTSLGGISATLYQANLLDPLIVALPVSLLSVDQVNACTPVTATPACLITAVTAQVPFEMRAPNPLAANPVADIGSTTIVFSAGTSQSQPMQLVPEMDQIHVITNCDAARTSDYGGLPCASTVTHADGSLVTSSAPAKSGEELVVYAYGLGATNPAVHSGQAGAAPALNRIGVNVFFGPNLGVPLPTVPIIIDCQISPQCPAIVTPIYVGLTSGYVGLYQVNFRMPPPPSDFFACNGGVEWNTVIQLEGITSYDGAKICAAGP